MYENVFPKNTPSEITDKCSKCERLASMSPDGWNEMYSAAKKYYCENNSLSPPVFYVTDEGLPLGAWLEKLRICRKNGIYNCFLTEEHIAMLDKIGMLWDVYDYVFERSYNAAAAYYREHGDLECGSEYVTPDGIRLGAWLRYLRTQSKKNSRFLTDEQYQMLASIGMRWGSKYELQWDGVYQVLCEYYRANGNINLPAAYVTPDGVRLGRWIRRQIELHGNGQLTDSRTERLEKLGIVWNTDSSWEEKFRLAKKYSDEHNGILSMPSDYVTDGICLSKWLNEQKLTGEGRRKKQLTPEQRERLESIGLVFGKTKSDIAWHNRYMEAKRYHDEHGNVNIPTGYKDASGKNLYVWVGRQRKYYRCGRLSDEKIKLLTDIGIISGFGGSPGDDCSCAEVCCGGHGTLWDAYAQRWQQMYQSAVIFYNKNGNLKVPPKYRTENGKDLYDWLQRQKKQYRTGKLNEYKITLLRCIGFSFGKNPPKNTAEKNTSEQK
ncbi:MAG: helicase associated domain-containing protein [Ruminococcus sp.]|nr:helicase associated domain-containing protein [Ruminococcus sp.]